MPNTEPKNEGAREPDELDTLEATLGILGAVRQHLRTQVSSYDQKTLADKIAERLGIRADLSLTAPQQETEIVDAVKDLTMDAEELLRDIISAKKDELRNDSATEALEAGVENSRLAGS